MEWWVRKPATRLGRSRDDRLAVCVSFPAVVQALLGGQVPELVAEIRRYALIATRTCRRIQSSVLYKGGRFGGRRLGLSLSLYFRLPVAAILSQMLLASLCLFLSCVDVPGRPIGRSNRPQPIKTWPLPDLYRKVRRVCEAHRRDGNFNQAWESAIKNIIQVNTNAENTNVLHTCVPDVAEIPFHVCMSLGGLK